MRIALQLIGGVVLNCGNDYAGNPVRVKGDRFIFSEMENVVAKYRAAGNDWRVLNSELNLGAKL